jgi:(p)ppGpp synthase/HD superfamily hydrolase
MNNVIENAREFADQAHRSVGQTRKYTQEPYINHPVAVMNILDAHSSHSVSDAQRMAALLHDVVEDTKVTLEEIEQRFGGEVAQLVNWLTDVSKPGDGPRRVRKAMDLAHTAAAPVEAKNIKLCDLTHNARDITQHDPDFARVWLREKAALLEVLSDADPALLILAHTTLEECRQQLRERT